MASSQILLLIDANSLVHRAWHALPPLTTAKGESVQAVYGFLSILFKVLKECNPLCAVAAFDMALPTKRHIKFAAYKATRQKAPDELYAQFPRVKEALSAFGIPYVELAGYEADDLIGTLAYRAKKEMKNTEVLIVSGDMDALQLVDEKVSVYTMRKGMKDTVVYDVPAVEAKFGGLTPKQLIDFKGLRGDVSDNIPGVRGIGEKTAIELLKNFGSLDALYEKLQKDAYPEDVRKKVAELLRDQKEQALLSRELGTIDCRVPIEFDLNTCKWKEYDRAKAEQLLRELEFRSLIVRMPGGKAKNAQPKAGSGAHKQEALFGNSKEASSALVEDDIYQKIDWLYKQEVLSPYLYEIEKLLTPILRNMEARGIAVDVPYFHALSHEMEQELDALKKTIFQLAGKEFNVSSTQQLSQVLFEELNLPTKGLKKTPKGVISTASPELEKLSSHPIIARILSWREIQKLATTYAKPLAELADEHSRVHTHFDQLGAATGRLSSSNPNLQNIPAQGAWGRRIRRGFVAEKGWKLVSFDYSQMELRIAAHLAQDEKMQEAFQRGEDIHKATAAAVFGIPLDQVTADMRYRAKALNFGILYGMGAMGFAKSAGISLDEARAFIDSYFMKFALVRAYIERIKEEVRAYGYAQTMFGRKRYIPAINSAAPHLKAAAERMAINHPIQGTLADITKIAMVEIEKQMKTQQDQWHLLLQIHDELVFEMADGIIDETAFRIRRVMKEVCNLNVPVEVDVKVGENWDEMERIL
ncbi:MAG: hypothetical protein A2748_01675 [Candidatus Wildermuthbacteria bacterium RIFCSPHIGHO2_01_FULL_45_20]|nr:MAG: hypothetical protein A2748_01675 [Candidatus Wildermuthbacteria bacterium RIFCSPHIGHO2_01_FULL_45_20]